MTTTYTKLTEEQWQAKKAATKAKKEATRAEAKANAKQRREDLFKEAVEAHKGQYKAVPENPKYFAFDDGRIWSTRTSRFLKPYTQNLGYQFIGQFFVNGKQTLQLLHRMIAFTFIPNPEGLPEINHKDGNKHNNDISNLEWCNRQYNMQHARENGLMIPGMLNKASTRRKLDFGQAEEIREKYAKGGISMDNLALQYGIHPSNVKRILKGTTYKVQ